MNPLLKTQPILVEPEISPGLTVIPYLPALLENGLPHYHHHLQVRPIRGQSEAEVTFDRYAWKPGAEEWGLSRLDPLSVFAGEPSPFLVVGPLNLDPECPQIWTVKSGSAAMTIGAIPRRPELPALNLMPGVSPPEDDAPYTMTLPPRLDLPDMAHILPCRLQVFPLSPLVSIAVRFRIFNRGEPIGDTPYLFRSALAGPRAWEIQQGRRIMEEDPRTGELRELVEATPESGQIAPAITVFSGRLLANFSWRASPSATVFSVAGLIPGTATFGRDASGYD